MRRNKTAKVGIVVAILLLTVAFAAVSTTLTINGSASVKSNNTEFTQNIVFANEGEHVPYLLVNDDTAHVDVTVNDSGKTLEFTVPEAFDTVGNHAVLHYWVANKSTNYDATIKSINCSVKNAGGEVATDGYIEATPANNLVNTTVTKSTGISDESTVDVRMAKSYAKEGTAEYKVECTIDAEGSEA